MLPCFLFVFEYPFCSWKSRGVGSFGISAPQGKGFAPEVLPAGAPAAWDGAWPAGEAW